MRAPDCAATKAVGKPIKAPDTAAVLTMVRRVCMDAILAYEEAIERVEDLAEFPAHYCRALMLVGCSENTPAGDDQGYNFGGVIDDPYMGEIDQTVNPRRPDGPSTEFLIIADDFGSP